MFRVSQLKPAIALKGAFLPVPWLYGPLCSGTSGLAIVFRRLVFDQVELTQLQIKHTINLLHPFATPFSRNAKTKPNENIGCIPKIELLLAHY